jgi:GntR family transcriptional regulator / MocR family aminotransferase
MLPYKTLIKIDRELSISLYIQLCNAFITLITKGLLSPYDKLPSSRKLSELLIINRNTIKLAFEELVSQGWAESRPRKGIFVMATLPLTNVNEKDISNTQNLDKNVSFKWKNNYIETVLLSNLQKASLAINDGFPDVRLAPVDILMREYRSISGKNFGKGFLNYGNPMGSEKLRIAFSNYLSDTRGIHANLENILITRGSQMGIYLATQLILNPLENVVVGYTNYFAADATFKLMGSNLIRIPIDDKGMDIDYLEEVLKTKKIKLVYVIPHHHSPTTVTLSMERRLKLLNLAKQYQFAIIEDDYDFDFHYSSKPFLPLSSIDFNKNVIYTGSLCKIFAPALRIGFLVGPEKFIQKAASLRRLIDRQGDSLLEESVAELFNSGEMKRHFRKSLKLYHKRRDVFCDVLKTNFSNHINFEIPQGGLAIWAGFDETINLPKIAELAFKKGLYINDGSYYKNEKFNANFIRMGFASLNEDEIYRSLDILKKIL